MKIIRTGYIVYGVILTLILLYFRFPSDAISEYFQSRFNRAFPDYRLSIDNVSLYPPFALEFSRPRVSVAHGDSWQVTIDKFRLMPEILSFLRGDPGCLFSARIYGGDLKGRMDFPEGIRKASYTAELEFRDLKIGESRALSGPAMHHMEGLLNGHIRFSSKSGFFKDGAGDGVLNISDGYFSLPESLPGLEAVYYQSLKVEMTVDNMRLQLRGLELRGEEMSATASGSLFLNKDFSMSNLNIRGAIEPHAGLLKSIMSSDKMTVSLRERLKEGKIPFVIQGTVRNPGIRFI